MFDPWVRKVPWRRKWQRTPVFFPGKSHGQRSLVGYSSWGCRVGPDLATKQVKFLTTSATWETTNFIMSDVIKSEIFYPHLSVM